MRPALHSPWWLGAGALAAALGMTACRADVPASTPAADAPSAAPAPARAQPVATEAGADTIEVVAVAGGLEHPWGLAFLPDGRMLVTERPGRLRVVAADGTLSAPLAGVPAVYARGQGGLLDVALDPDFAANQLVYLSYSEPGDDGTGGTSVARGRFAGDRLEGTEVVFRQSPKLDGGQHFGSRLAFDRAGNLFVTSGDRMEWPNVQRLDRGQGKVFRIRPDGSVPADNPYVGRSDAQPEVWSYGHRNAQGAAIHPGTGELWEVEHGARGGDELNVARAGRNYGWPEITLGVNYDGNPIGTGKKALPGMEQPIHAWTPSIAPSGMAFYTADRFPQWQGNVFVGALAHEKLVRLTLDGERVVAEEHLLTDRGDRIRDVVQGPDGYLYVLTDDDDGEILRVGPEPAAE
jgi:glucose/arabinose dehydrogenase